MWWIFGFAIAVVIAAAYRAHPPPVAAHHDRARA